MAAAVDLLSSPLLRFGRSAARWQYTDRSLPMHPLKWMVDFFAQPLSQTITLRGGSSKYGTGSTGLSESRFEDCEKDGVDDIEACGKKADHPPLPTVGFRWHMCTHARGRCGGEGAGAWRATAGAQITGGLPPAQQFR
jgi:hypothetical protein